VADLGSYLSPVETLVNIVFKLVPIAVTATTMTIEIPAAISAYSMAVAPLVSFRNRRSMATFPLSGGKYIQPGYGFFKPIAQIRIENKPRAGRGGSW